ncbi:cytochrome oxidase [Thiopseudomonas alkaliphila]|uniref:CcoQ/FixQ family Cbb3-type cytochrome c oxidase assembly chaperone n=1 Tax=Thiopseudomonas alkaliphila TaxID=1697053 RepID=A0A0K1XCK0_9GAMM|nr:CcoQ/FixQ family Cbb3-type cytochrome c oxidase assembly chaperone [Thiopseudomonas alkaliphila]AKX44491.1 cytochrome oxidase [Thiopseudomonas alkaliphila]AKX46679.1 cytochrome oxidase [Thiopseudomonas alkaliphila]AKX49783.1 cytochrome oxidase [Thiopseudomonas alkaliphila]AKX50506.1 cytochrome oxidase [Thiopseudomonas alkaliphila]AKX52326.1 cytochrome oxidase [Thiopseudomonas alkaliphila]
MEIGTIRGLGTLIVFIAFVGLLYWVFGKKKSSFEDAANLPFADEQSDSGKLDQDTSRSKNQ